MNSNYPPGTWAGDPAAPWNKGKNAWENEVCEECLHFYRHPEDKHGLGFCSTCTDWLYGDDGACCEFEPLY